MCTPLVVFTSVGGAGGWEGARAEGQGGGLELCSECLYFLKMGNVHAQLI